MKDQTCPGYTKNTEIEREATLAELKLGGKIEFDKKTLLLASGSITRKRIMEQN